MHLFVFVIALFMVMRGATLATKYATRFAETFRLSKYTVGFLVIAVISILPETFISINAAAKDIPEFGLGMLFGSNVADLTLILALVVLFARRGLKVERRVMENHVLYPFILLLPIVLGLDGFYTRIEGLALIVAGGIFYYLALRKEQGHGVEVKQKGTRVKNFWLLIASLAVLLAGGHFVVTSATGIAEGLGVSPILIGMLVVGLGTTIPELMFSLKSVRQKDDSLAIGDILGTVLADATIVVGLLAVMNPFAFPKETIYVAGVFMVAAAFILFNFLRSGHILTKREALSLFIFWITFVLVQFILGT